MQRPSASPQARISLAVAALAGLVCALAVAFDRPPLVRYSDVTPPHRPPRSTTTSTQQMPTGPGAPKPPADLNGFSEGLAKLFFVFVAVIVLIVLGWLAIVLARSLRIRRRRRRAVPVHLPAPSQVVADSIDQAIEQLPVGSPDNAIIRCWVMLQEAARTGGVEPRPSETSAELTVRLLDDLDVDRPAVARLSALYREARFSSHALSEQDRDVALEALHTIRAGLSLPERADA